MFAAVLGLAATFLYRRYLLGKLGVFTGKEILVGQSTIAALMCIAFFVTVGPWWNTFAPEKQNPSIWWIGLGMTTIVGFVIQFANMRVASLAEASFTAPISAMTPGLVLLSALMIGEKPGRIGIIGIIIVGIGTFIHVREGASWREYLKPLFFWRLFSPVEKLPEAERNKILALRWAYASATCGSIGLLGDGLIARHGDMILAVTIQLVAFALGFMVFVPNRTNDERSKSRFFPRLRANAPRMVIMGIVYGLPFILLGVAFRLAPIASIGSLKRLSLVLIAIGGSRLLGEQSGTRRVLLSMIIVVGAILISLDPTSAVFIDSLDAHLQ